MQRKIASYKEKFETLNEVTLKDISKIFINKFFGRKIDISELKQELDDLDPYLTELESFVIVSDLTKITWAYVTPGCYQVLGYTSEELMKAGGQFLFDNICPADRALQLEFFNIISDYVTNSETVDIREYYFNNILRLFNANGYLIWLKNTLLFSHVDKKGKPVISISLLSSIDDIKSNDTQQLTITQFNKASNAHKIILSDSRRPEGMNLLSANEIEILRLLTEGLNNCEIAERLGYKESTIKDMRKKMLRKTWCTNTIELIYFAYRNNLIS